MPDGKHKQHAVFRVWREERPTSANEWKMLIFILMLDLDERGQLQPMELCDFNSVL